MRTRLLTLGAIAAGLTLVATIVAPSAHLPTTEFPVAYAASVDYFLKLDGVEGESKNDRHRNEIEILSFSWGLSQGGTSGVRGGGGAGKASFQDMHFSMPLSKASPKLFLAAATGEHIPKAVFTSAKPDKNGDYLKITLTDILVSSYQQDGSQGTIPTDQFSLNFTKIEYEYSPTKPDGSLDASVKAGYDVKANKKV